MRATAVAVGAASAGTPGVSANTDRRANRLGRATVTHSHQHRAERLQRLDTLLTAAEGLARTLAQTEALTARSARLLASRPSSRRASSTPAKPVLISLAEASRQSGRHPEVLRRWCVEGRIPAVRVGRTWGLSRETTAELVNHGARSRPRFRWPAAARAVDEVR